MLDGPLERLLFLAFGSVLVLGGGLLIRALVSRRTTARLGTPLELAVENPSAPTVLYFYGPSCPACVSQRRALTALRQRRPTPFNVVPLEAGRSAELGARAGVLTIPTTVVLDADRRVRAINHGFHPAETLAAQLETL